MSSDPEHVERRKRNKEEIDKLMHLSFKKELLDQRQ